MGILDKVRDFFYDDEEEFEEIKKKPSKHNKEKIKIIEKEDKKELEIEKQDISERELFKAERTFNFPFDVDDEEKDEEEEKTKIEEIKEEVKHNTFKETKPLSIRNYTKYEKEVEEEASKKFKPTPVISPIYGILDKNYKKEDLLISDNKKNHEEEKKLDYESVRKRAYSKSYDKEEGDSKGIFFNLDDNTKNEEDDVKIIYNDIDEDDKNKTIGEKIEEYEKSLEDKKNNEEDEDILSETNEQDLFNLIDNMYNSDDDEDEEE